MEPSLEKGKKELRSEWLWWLAAWGVGIKTALVDYSADSGYAVAMAKRLLDGDGMFREAWEPHQTSAFVIEALLWFYKLVVPSGDGVVLFLHLVNLLAFFLLAMLLRNTFRRFTEGGEAALAGLLFFVLRPKMVQMPDYANLLVAFSALAFLFLARWLLEKERLRWLVFAGLVSCLTVLAYPSAVILFAAILVFTCLRAEKKEKGRAALAYAGPCLIFGGAYGGYFAATRSPLKLLETAKWILRSDSHSGESVYRGGAYFQEFLVTLLCMGGAAALAAGILLLLEKASGKRFCRMRSLAFPSALLGLGVERSLGPRFPSNANFAWWAVGFGAILLVIGVGIFGVNALNQKERELYECGMTVAAGSFFAVALLTNLSLLTIFGYLFPAAAVSFLPLQKLFSGGQNGRKEQGLLPAVFCLLAVMAFQGTLNLGKVENYVRTGPLFGIITTLEECNAQKIGLGEWEAQVSKADTVLILQSHGIDPIYYAATPAGIAASSTISTPSYSETLMDYWSFYPHKVPDVLAVPCWMGEEKEALPLWLERLRAEAYEPVQSGTYWNFYRRRE